MEEKIMENEVLEVETEENNDYEIEVFDDDETEDDGCENESGVSAGVGLLIGGLAVAGAVSIGRAIWKGVGKLRAKASEKKAAKSENNVIDITSAEVKDAEETEENGDSEEKKS